jgi:hypothetical protein
MDEQSHLLLGEIEDFLVDLVGTFNDMRAQGHSEFRSDVGSRFESKARDYAGRLGLLVKIVNSSNNPV